MLDNIKNKMIKSLCLVILLCLTTLIVSVYAQEQNLVYLDYASKTAVDPNGDQV